MKKPATGPISPTEQKVGFSLCNSGFRWEVWFGDGPRGQVGEGLGREVQAGAPPFTAGSQKGLSMSPHP